MEKFSKNGWLEVGFCSNKEFRVGFLIGFLIGECSLCILAFEGAELHFSKGRKKIVYVEYS